MKLLSIQLTVLLFAKARDLAGTSTATVEIPDRATVEDLKNSLVDRFPALATISSSLLWAVNHEYVTVDRKLADGETVACFPPVSGG